VIDETYRRFSMNEERRNAYKVLIEKPEGIKYLRTPRNKWEGNMKIHVGGLDNYVNWI
jgi:hypothetical protein